ALTTHPPPPHAPLLPSTPLFRSPPPAPTPPPGPGASAASTRRQRLRGGLPPTSGTGRRTPRWPPPGSRRGGKTPSQPLPARPPQIGRAHLSTPVTYPPPMPPSPS